VISHLVPVLHLSSYVFLSSFPPGPILISAALAMALSVSAFPEHIQARHSNDVLSTAEDGNIRNVVTAPRILGFFGGVSSGASSKKPEPYSSPRLGARDDDPDAFNSFGVNTPTPTVPISPSFQFSPPHNEKPTKLEEQGTAWPQNPQDCTNLHLSVERLHLLPSVWVLRLFQTGWKLELRRGLYHFLHTRSFKIHSTAGSHSPAWGSNDPLPVLLMAPRRFLPHALFQSFQILVQIHSRPDYLRLRQVLGPSFRPSREPDYPSSRSASAIIGSSKHTNALPSPPVYSSSIPVPRDKSGSVVQVKRLHLPAQLPPSLVRLPRF
jgi:hypothetical protein